LISFGAGWGKFNGKNTLKNPLSVVSNKLSYRPLRSDNYQRGGGRPSYDQWFRGDISLFGGIEYLIPNVNGLKLKLEYDPLNYLNFSGDSFYDLDYELREKQSNINLGLSYPWNKHLNLELSYIKGNTLNLSFSYGFTFSDNKNNKPKFLPNTKIRKNANQSKKVFYEDLLSNLNANRLFLQTSNLDNRGKLDISISTSEYRNAIRSSSYASYIAQKVANVHDINLSLINVSHINAGIELNNISYIAKHHSDTDDTPIELKIRNTKLGPGTTGDNIGDEFQPKVNFPVIFSSLRPSLVSYIGSPEKFYFGGLNLDHNSEVQFSRNLLLTSEISFPVGGGLSDIPYNPDSVMQHVRTDLSKYLEEDDPHINRMQLDYIWSPYTDVYSKITGGILEQMFGGFGGEILYKPFNKNYSFSYEMFYVKQRAFDKRFKFQEYETTTGHLNFSYRFRAGIESNLSYGRYLAKDDGFTFDLARTTRSGFKAGIFFTRTNVSAETFGEGSFDKGFYFQIPLDLLMNQYNGNYSSFKVSPLTRDGGAKLIHGKDLRGLIYNSTMYELSRQWDGLID
jgi:hypothetical protein